MIKLFNFLALGLILLTIGCGYESGETATESVSVMDTTIAHDFHLPEFPWPPPRPSAFYKVPKRYFNKCDKLDDVDALISNVLDQCGYYEKTYYSIPNGFAIVTRMEQINTDATSKGEPARWSVDPELYAPNDIMSYLRAVFISDPGLFRVFVITVSDMPFKLSENSITEEEAERLLNNGLTSLPSSLGDILKSKDTFSTVLVYEFEKPLDRDTSYILLPSRHDGRLHLNKSNILKKIDQL